MSRERSDRVVRRFALVTVVLPAAVTAVGPAVQLAALPQAPVADPGVSPRNLRVADHHRDVPSAARASERHDPTRSACGSRPSPGSPWGVAAALVGWLLQQGSRLAPKHAVTPLELAPSERAAWMRTASLPVPAGAVITATSTIVALKAGFG